MARASQKCSSHGLFLTWTLEKTVNQRYSYKKKKDFFFFTMYIFFPHNQIQWLLWGEGEEFYEYLLWTKALGKLKKKLVFCLEGKVSLLGAQQDVLNAVTGGRAARGRHGRPWCVRPSRVAVMCEYQWPKEEREGGGLILESSEIFRRCLWDRKAIEKLLL